VRYRELARLNMAEITGAIRDWAAHHPSGTAEEAVTDLKLPYPRDMVIIARGIMAGFRRPSEPREETS
jgi:hypothetical protein